MKSALDLWRADERHGAFMVGCEWFRSPEGWVELLRSPTDATRSSSKCLDGVCEMVDGDALLRGGVDCSGWIMLGPIGGDL